MSLNSETEVETETETPAISKKLSAKKINEIFMMRFKENLTERQIAEKSGVSLSSVNRMLKDIDNPRSPIIKENNSQTRDLEATNAINAPLRPQSSHEQPKLEETLSPSSFTSPSLGVVFTPEDIMTARQGMTKQQQRIFDGVLSLASQRMRENRTHDGHGVPMQYSGSNPYIPRMIQMWEAQQFKELMGIGKKNTLTKEDIERVVRDEMRRGKSDDSEFKTALKIVQFGQALRGENKTLAQTIAEAQTILEAIKSINPSETSSLANITPDQYMMVLEKKFNLEERRADKKAQRKSESEKIGLIKEIAIPVIKKLGPAIDELAGAGQRKLSQVATSKGTPNQEFQGFMICPECLKNGITTPIDVRTAPKVVECPTCHKEYRRPLTEEEKAEESAKTIETQEEKATQKTRKKTHKP